jgi:hypothetical protein
MRTSSKVYRKLNTNKGGMGQPGQRHMTATGLSIRGGIRYFYSPKMVFGTSCI